MSNAELDVITINGITAFGLHGVYPLERRSGQEFRVDITLWVDTHTAALTDDLDYTVDYSQVAVAVSQILAGTPVNLLETLADTIAKRVLAFPLVEEVTVVVHKPQAPLGVQFSDLSLTIHRTRETVETGETFVKQVVDLNAYPPQPVTATIALGANLGDAPRVMAQAVVALDENPYISLNAVSGLFKTAPILMPGQAAQPDYYNAVLEVITTLSPLGLLETLHQLEADAGRVRKEKWEARPLDLDILTFADLHSDDEQLILPHPRAHQRAFVLQPWLQINPAATLGKHGRVAVLAEQVKDQTVELLADIWVEEALRGDFSLSEPTQPVEEPFASLLETSNTAAQSASESVVEDAEPQEAITETTQTYNRTSYLSASDTAVESPIFAEIAGRRSALQTDWVLTKHQIERDWELREVARLKAEQEEAEKRERAAQALFYEVQRRQEQLRAEVKQETAIPTAAVEPENQLQSALWSEAQSQPEVEAQVGLPEVASQQVLDVPDFNELITGEYTPKPAVTERKMPSWKRVVSPPQPRIVDEGEYDSYTPEEKHPSEAPIFNTPEVTTPDLTTGVFPAVTVEELLPEEGVVPAPSENEETVEAPEKPFTSRLRRRQILRPHPTGATPAVRRPAKDTDTATFEDFFGSK